MAISAPSHYKNTLIIKFYNGVFGISLNRHLKQTAVVKSVFLRFNLSTFVKCQVSLNYLVMFYFICNLLKKKKKNVFDERFGFLLKHKIVSRKEYNNVKSYFFRGQSTYP